MTSAASALALVGLVAGSVWLFGAPLILIATFAACNWLDRRRMQAERRRLGLLVALEQCWDLPPAERRRG